MKEDYGQEDEVGRSSAQGAALLRKSVLEGVLSPRHVFHLTDTVCESARLFVLREPRSCSCSFGRVEGKFAVLRVQVV
jgi:hypothetical protein